MKNSEAILVTPKQFEIQECPVPEPKDHEILMKVEYVGMCGSDIHGFEFGPFIPPKDPNQKIGLGHEVAGEVVKVGSKVTRFKAGDKVLIEPGLQGVQVQGVGVEPVDGRKVARVGQRAVQTPEDLCDAHRGLRDGLGRVAAGGGDGAEKRFQADLFGQRDSGEEK